MKEPPLSPEEFVDALIAAFDRLAKPGEEHLVALLVAAITLGRVRFTDIVRLADIHPQDQKWAKKDLGRKLTPLERCCLSAFTTLRPQPENDRDPNVIYLSKSGDRRGRPRAQYAAFQRRLVVNVLMQFLGLSKSIAQKIVARHSSVQPSALVKADQRGAGAEFDNELANQTLERLEEMDRRGGVKSIALRRLRRLLKVTP